MPDLEDVKAEFDQLDSKDKRWISIALAVAVSALILASLGGSLFGDFIAFVLTFAAGWFVNDQWNVIRTSRSNKAPAKRRKTPARRKRASTTRSSSSR